MEINCERCGQQTGQNENRKTKAGSQRYVCKHCGKTYTPVKKREDVSRRAKRPGDRTVCRRKQWKSGRPTANSKQKYVFEVDTAKS